VSPFPHLAQRLFNTPLALHPHKAEVALAALADRLGIARVETGLRSLAFDDDGDWAEDAGASPSAGYDLLEGIACIQADGMLVQRTGTLRPYSGMTGYDGLRANLLAALADEQAKAVAFLVSSGGGEVSGMMDLGDLVFASRGRKPIWAICDDHAYSAAYCVASACDRVTVPRTGGVGSVGIITMMVDYSRAIKASGLEVHFVHYGARKAEETRQIHQGVKQDLLDRIQADVDMMGDLFTATVARNRRMSQKDIQAQQADYYLGDRGVAVGLADAVRSPDEAFAELLDLIS
jgi:ClpP class serine protease